MKEVRLKARANIARTMQVDSYDVLVAADDKVSRDIIARARKTQKMRKHSTPRFFYSGSPYIILGRKVNSKGKIVR